MLKISRWPYLLGPKNDSGIAFVFYLWNVGTTYEEAALNGGRSQDGNEDSQVFKSEVRNV